MKKKLFIPILSVIIFNTVSHTKLYAQSAIKQLEDITGQQINRYSYSDDPNYSPPAPVPDQAYYNEQFKNYMLQASNDENEKGNKFYVKRDWQNAISHYKKAAKMFPSNQVYKTNLQNAIEQKRREDEIAEKNKNVEKNNKIFVNTLNSDIKIYANQTKSLRKSIKSYVPPLQEQFPKKIHEGIILGLYNTQDKNQVKNLTSPFSGKKYNEGEYFATSDNDSNNELVRGIVDNGTLGKYTLNSEHGKKLVQELNGTHFNRLIAHSNGATVTEALIREGVIQVDELNIMGGDRSLINYFGYNDLIASGKVKRIVVWLNPGDIVPYGSSAGLISPFNGAREQNLRNFASFFDYKLKGTNAGNQVEYRWLSGSQYKGQKIFSEKGVFDSHGIDVYYDNVNTWLGN